MHFTLLVENHRYAHITHVYYISNCTINLILHHKNINYLKDICSFLHVIVTNVFKYFDIKSLTSKLTRDKRQSKPKCNVIINEFNPRDLIFPGT